MQPVSDGFDKFNDSDINAARYAASITLFALSPFHIASNLLTIFIICLFKTLQTTQNMLVASTAFNGLLCGVWFSPSYGVYWLPNYDLSGVLSNQYACYTFYIPIFMIGLGSLVNLTMITADRYFAVVYPFQYAYHMSVGRLKRVLVVVWVVCLLYSLVPFVWNDDKSGECELYSTISKYYIRFVTFPILTICMVSSSVFNFVVFRTAFRQKHKRRTTIMHLFSDNQHQANREQDRRSKLSCLLYANYLVFFTPYMVSIPFLFGDNHSKTAMIFHTLASAFSNFHFTSTTLVYMFVKQRSRTAARLLLRTPPWQWPELRCHRFDGEYSDVIHSSAYRHGLAGYRHTLTPATSPAGLRNPSTTRSTPDPAIQSGKESPRNLASSKSGGESDQDQTFPAFLASLAGRTRASLTSKTDLGSVVEFPVKMSESAVDPLKPSTSVHSISSSIASYHQHIQN